MIIDELLTFFVAGMKTIQTTTTNLLCYLEMQPEIKARLMREILPPVENVKKNIQEGLDYEKVMEFDYL